MRESVKNRFFEGDVHLGHYDFRFDFNDKKHFSISQDGTGRFRVHTEKTYQNYGYYSRMKILDLLN